MEKQVKNKSSLTTILGNLDIIVAGAALIVLIVLTFAGVVMRYIVGQPFTWLEEVQLFCMVWIVFAAGGAAFRTKSHVAIEMVVEMFPEKIQKAMEYAVDVIVLLVVGFLFYCSIRFLNVFVANGRTTSMLGIPMQIQYGIAPVSYILMIVSYFSSRYFKGEEKGGE